MLAGVNRFTETFQDTTVRVRSETSPEVVPLTSIGEF